MDKCPYHQETDKRLRDCEMFTAAMAEHNKNVESLLKEIRESQEVAVTKWDTFMKAYFYPMKKEFDDFAWFRNAMNGIHNKIIFWILTGLLALLVVLIFIHEGIWDKAMRLLGKK